MYVSRRGGSCVVIGLFVVMSGEVIESLDCVTSVGMIADAVISGTVQVFKSVKSGLVVSM